MTSPKPPLNYLRLAALHKPTTEASSVPPVRDTTQLAPAREASFDEHDVIVKAHTFLDGWQKVQWGRLVKMLRPGAVKNKGSGEDHQDVSVPSATRGVRADTSDVPADLRRRDQRHCDYRRNKRTTSDRGVGKNLVTSRNRNLGKAVTWSNAPMHRQS